MKKLVSWVEIPSTDFNRAVDFYNSVFELSLQVFDCGNEKMACFPAGDGAVSYAPGFKPSADGPIVSLNAEDDMDNAIKRIVKFGGKILIPKTKIQVEERGYFATFLDTEGNRVGIYGNK